MKVRVAVVLALLGRTALATEPAKVWHPGESTTSRVDPEVDGDAGSAPYDSDGVHGRFGGDLDLGVTLGAHLDSDAVGGLAAATLHYFWMAGLSVTYVDNFGSDDARSQRLLAIGVDARPAFVPRFAEDLAHGPALLDLTLDSISLGLGVFWAAPPDGAFGDTRGFETSLGFGIPVLARASGPWLTTRGYLRVADLGGGGTATADTAVSLALSWHTIFSSR